MTERTLYFAYGSNLSLAQMARRCPASRAVGGAILRGHRLVFPRRYTSWQGGVAGLEPSDAHHVEGAVYELTDACLATLDEYEGIDEGHYTRGRVRVELRDGRVIEVMTYIANYEDGAPFQPSDRYIDVILEGCRDHGLSAAWAAMIEALRK
ncbi:MAG: gamma-glutamylcyclotransferase [Phycisphaera sp.]|nr:gamma-glutamylcyclotransferase [Phycisphaera sp.]